MLYFLTLNQYARTYDEAERLWEQSQDARSVGNAEGQRWLVALLRQSRDQAPDEHFKRHYEERVRQAECLLSAMAAPAVCRSPLG